MFRVEIEANRHGGSGSDVGHRPEDKCVSHTAADREGAEAIARRELHRQGVPADQVEFALTHLQHYSSVDVSNDLHAPAFTPESGAHDFTLRIFES